MLKRLIPLVLFLALGSLAGCGGSEEPTATPTPLATFTPTAAARATLAPAAIEEAPATPSAEEATPVADTVEITATVAITGGVGTGEADGGADVFAPSVLAPESPLAAPESPLAAPVSPLPAPGEAAVAPTAVPTSAPPISGAWQLQTIRSSSSVSETTAPPGYGIAFSRTGVARVAADCLTGRGAFTRDPSGILVFELAYSDVRCAPDSLADPFIQALTEVNSYRFDNDRLVLKYGTQGGEMGFTRAGQMAAFGAPYLSWTNLKNSTFLVPDAPSGDGQAPLVDGEFRANSTAQVAENTVVTATAATTAPAAADFVVSLATMHTYVELDPPTPEPTPATPPPADATPTPTPEPEETSYDTIAVLVVDDEAPAPKSYLVPVLNGGGLAIPLTIEPLGDSVYVRDLRWDGEQLTVDFDQGTEGKRRVYTFATDRFVQVSEEGLAPQPAKGRLDLPAQDVVLGATDANSGGAASLTGAIDAGVVHPYRLTAEAGQQLTVTLQSPFEDVWLSLYGEGDRTVLRSIRSETTTWTGAVPGTQGYVISAVASGSSTPYTLTIQLAGVGGAAAGAGTATPALTATITATQAPGDVIHLVVDGLPTAEVLDVLQRNGATADFFVTGAQAASGSTALNAALAAGHGIGIVAGPLSALTSDGRDALFAEVSAARQSLGGVGGKCLRPPYAATDGYTRAAAAELGFDIVLWDIDAGGTAADALAGQVFPGAIVRFAEVTDGEQGPAITLESLLPLLAQQGYSVQAACK
jgi:peptidoglycan/xylan/chitin deacetylase (PgdA/CDA1 family)